MVSNRDQYVEGFTGTWVSFFFSLLTTVNVQFHLFFYRNPVLQINCTALHVDRYWEILAQTILAQDALAQIILLRLLGTAFSGNNFDFGTCIEVERTISEYHNQLLPERVML